MEISKKPVTQFTYDMTEVDHKEMQLLERALRLMLNTKGQHLKHGRVIGVPLTLTEATEIRNLQRKVLQAIHTPASVPSNDDEEEPF